MSDYKVYVNDEETTQRYSSLTFSEGDVVKIVAKEGVELIPTFIANFTNSRGGWFASLSRLPKLGGVDGYPSTDAYWLAMGCDTIQEIPSDFFINNSQITSFDSTFYYCSSLSSIPEGLFDNNDKATNFYGTFSYCSSLTSIPEGLFDNNTKVTNFGYTFFGCSSLTSIPEGLFDNNTKVTDFSNTFDGCSSLTSIPENLFANNTKATTFARVFSGCRNLTGRIKIGSPIVTSCDNFCNYAGAMTVIVLAGSTTEATFRAYAETVTNLTVETFEP